MSPRDEQRPRTANPGASKSFSGDTHSLPEPADNRHADTLGQVLDPFARRLLQEAMTAAMPWHWYRRAEQLDDARPRPDEFHGQATRAQLSARWRSLTDAAEGCRRHARFLTEHPDAMAELIAADVATLMSEVV